MASAEKRTSGRFSVDPWRALHVWYRSVPGGLFAAEEMRALANVLPELFGYRSLTLGLPSACDMLAASRIRQRFYLEMQHFPGSCQDAVANPGYLPVASDYFDVVLISHALAFTAEPERSLQEADRVLIPEGYLLVQGFNPVSLWAWHCLRPRRAADNSFWKGGFLSPTALRVLLQRKGFQTLRIQHYFYRPPLQQPGLLERLAYLESLGQRYLPHCGGGYLVLAKKRVSTLTPIRPRWRPQRNFVTESIAN